MEIKKEAKFVTDFYGSAPAMGAEGILKKWIDDKQNDWLFSWAEKIKKKGETAIDALETNLSIFHRDKDGCPVIGNWMLRRCLVVTGQTIFNAMKDKTHPKKDIIPMAVSFVDPVHINVFNGKKIKKPDGVETYTVSLKTRSFFTAYEYIKAGATFETTMFFDNELLADEHIEAILNNCGKIGVGAFRERFGKFEFI